MKIGFSVEDSTHRAVIIGLAVRWCPDATLQEGHFRGSTRLALRREYQKICEEFLARGVDVMVFLTDADTDPWRDRQRSEREKFPQEHLGRAIRGIPDRNIESWICSDPDWLGQRLGENPARFRQEDPKGPFQRAMGIDRDEHKEDEIAELVRAAPLGRWIANASFEDFYEQARDLSQ
jgi:hypothetical protein